MPACVTLRARTAFPATMHCRPGRQRLSETTAVKVRDTPASDTATASPRVTEKATATGTERPCRAVVVVEGGLDVVVALDVVEVGVVVTVVDGATVVVGSVLGTAGTVVGAVALNAASPPPHEVATATIRANVRAADARCTRATLLRRGAACTRTVPAAPCLQSDVWRR